MNDFIFHNPDKVYFGRNQLTHLSEELLKFGNKVLLVYGGGSIKKNGLYDSIKEIAKKDGIELFELSGVEPNPRHSTVNRGAEICKRENISIVLAAGGGSTIDCAKGIAAAALTEKGDVWQLVSNDVWVTEALPVVANLMWASSMALNSILDGGMVHGCACHAMEHELSAYYDITHGHGALQS